VFSAVAIWCNYWDCVWVDVLVFLNLPVLVSLCVMVHCWYTASHGQTAAAWAILASGTVILLAYLVRLVEPPPGWSATGIVARLLIPAAIHMGAGHLVVTNRSWTPGREPSPRMVGLHMGLGGLELTAVGGIITFLSYSAAGAGGTFFVPIGLIALGLGWAVTGFVQGITGGATKEVWGNGLGRR
jgi:hypothetical protein